MIRAFALHLGQPSIPIMIPRLHGATQRFGGQVRGRVDAGTVVVGTLMPGCKTVKRVSKRMKILTDRMCVTSLLSPSYTVTILATTELRLTPIYQVVMHRHES